MRPLGWLVTIAVRSVERAAPAVCPRCAAALPPAQPVVEVPALPAPPAVSLASGLLAQLGDGGVPVAADARSWRSRVPVGRAASVWRAGS